MGIAVAALSAKLNVVDEEEEVDKMKWILRTDKF